MEEIKIASVLTTIALVLIAVLLFELIIFIHEFGHFITAKKSGIKVNEFSLGMGPKILSFGKGETKYSLRIFPIGGFCVLYGEDEDSPEPRAFNNAKIWKRMIVIVAGAVMNIILGLLLMFVIVVQQDAYGSTTVSDFPVSSFSANSGLEKGDVIKEIDGYGISNSMDFNYPISTSELKEVKGDSLEIYKEDCCNYLFRQAATLVQNDENIPQKTLDEINALISTGATEINAVKDKNSAKELYYEYSKSLYELCKVKDYKIEEIEVKETRQRYVADVLVDRKGENTMDELRVLTNEETTQYIVIKIGVEQFGIDIKYVDNIVRMQHITRVPKVANYLKGVINLRGEVIPVMSLRLKMELEEVDETKTTRIIILKLEQHGTIGIIVDEVREVVTLGTSQIEKVAHDNRDDSINFLTGVGKYNGELISLLDLNAVATEKENA